MKKLKIQFLFKIFVIIIFLISLIYTFIYALNYKFNTNNYARGTIYNISQKDNYCLVKIKSNFNYLMKFNDCSNIRVGRKIEFYYSHKGVNSNTIFNTFDYRKYLKSLNIKEYGSVSSYHLFSFNKSVMYRDNLIRYLKKRNSYSYIKLFIFSDNSDLDNDIKNAYTFNGISYLLCVSGFHLSFILNLISKLLKKIKINFKCITFILLIVSFLYLYLSFFTVPLLRAFIFYWLSYINKNHNLKFDKYFIFVLTLSICLFIKPFSIFGISFWYSFTLSFFILRFSDIYSNKSRIKTTFYLALYSFSISFPISIYVNHYINILSIICSIIFTPIICFIIYPLSILSIFSTIIDRLLIVISLMFNKINLFLNSIKFFMIIFPKFSIYILIFMYLLLFLIYFYNWKIAKIILILTIIYIKYYLYLSSFLKVYVIDVGQGDMISVIMPYHKGIILIDSGGLEDNKYLSKNITSFLYSRGITKIDYWIFTHGDFDHMGEAINLVNNFKIENVIFNCGEYNDLEQELIKVLDKKKIKYYSCIKELNIDKYKLEFLNTKEYDNENDNSNVIYFNYEGNKFLFMGDAGIEKEKDILDKYSLENIDFLKVGHHGSNTGSSEYFIDYINPKYSLISVGKNNRYGHPKEVVLETLKNTKIYRTDLDGSIEIKLNKNGYKIRTCSP